ncbi:unnamed protein product [Tetraodon nigroviridis]|uniref:(spotted green pufferfish) hypothetical protein n=1 Tax=Tetraodon nigroviridis TaxID=99883 RepID=Q4SCX2_TETNG|nr:unnamed protein product [Tetraodon nigroviridis]
MRTTWSFCSGVVMMWQNGSSLWDFHSTGHVSRKTSSVEENSFVLIVPPCQDLELQILKTCRSSLPTCASCWESPVPHGAAAAASPTLRGTFGPCSWRKRVGQVSGQTASPTSSSWTASTAWRESRR